MTNSKYIRPLGFLLFAQILFAGLIWQATANEAELPTRPSISYKANVSLSVGTITLLGTTWYTPDKERSELGFGGAKFKGKPSIHRRDKGLLFILNEANKTYFTQTLKPGSAQSSLINHKFTEQTKIGTDTIEGIKATKYRVKSDKRKNRQLIGHVWISKDNVLLRVDAQITAKGKTNSFKYALTNLVIGPQPAALFELPKGYRFAKPTVSELGLERRTPKAQNPESHKH